MCLPWFARRLPALVRLSAACHSLGHTKLVGLRAQNPPLPFAPRNSAPACMPLRGMPPRLQKPVDDATNHAPATTDSRPASPRLHLLYRSPFHPDTGRRPRRSIPDLRLRPAHDKPTGHKHPSPRPLSCLLSRLAAPCLLFDSAPNRAFWMRFVGVPEHCYYILAFDSTQFCNVEPADACWTKQLGAYVSVVAAAIAGMVHVCMGRVYSTESCQLWCQHNCLCPERCPRHVLRYERHGGGLFSAASTFLFPFLHFA